MKKAFSYLWIIVLCMMVNPVSGCIDADTLLVNKYLTRISYHTGRNNDSLKFYADRLRQIGETSGQSRWVAIANRVYGVYHWYRSEFRESLQHYHLSLQYWQENMDSVEMGKTLSGIGLVHSNLDNLDVALQNYYQSLKLITRDTPARARILNSIAVVYRNNNDLDSAMAVHREAEVLFIEANDLAGVAGSSINVGNIFKAQGLFHKAIHYQLKALQIFDSLKMEGGIISALNNLGDCYVKLGDISKARNFLKEAYDRSMNSSNTRSAIIALTQLGHAEFKAGDYDKSGQYLNQAMDLALKYQQLNSIREIMDARGRVLLIQGKYKEAAENFQSLVLLTDSLRSKEKTRQIENLKITHSQEKKDAEIAVLSLDNKITSLQRNMLALAMIILVLTVVGFSMRFRLKRQRETKFMLESQVKERTLALEESNNLKDKLFSIIGHDLRSPVNSLNSILDMLTKENISREEFLSFAGELKHQVQETSVLLENLLRWSKNRISSEAPVLKLVSLNMLLQRNRNLFLYESQKKEIDITISCDPALKIRVNEQEFDLIIRNLLINAIKYSYRGGVIRLVAEKMTTHTYIVVQDFGMGMDEKQRHNVFTPDLQSIRGTENEKGSGLGLLLCYELAKRNKSTITCDTEEGRGTVFTIEVPDAVEVELPEPSLVTHY
jgi:signal transduction histidine kinase